MKRLGMAAFSALARSPAPLPVAVEVELTCKAPRRLASICQAWARCRCVAGVIYLAAPDVLRPLARAIEQAHAGERVIALPLDVLSCRHGAPGRD